MKPNGGRARGPKWRNMSERSIPTIIRSPVTPARDGVVRKGDVRLIDFDMVGGNHDERNAVANGTLAHLTSACAKKPADARAGAARPAMRGTCSRGSGMFSGTFSGGTC